VIFPRIVDTKKVRDHLPGELQDQIKGGFPKSSVISGGNMSESHPLSELHPLCLGKLIGNLLTIELLARLFLHNSGGQPQNLNELLRVKVEEFVSLSPLTDGRSLREVLEAYNKSAKNYPVETSRIVDLRDALAHGKVFGSGSIQTVTVLRLLKFKRNNKKDKKVQVTVAEDMTEAWFVDNIKFLEDSAEKIRIALGYGKDKIS
jgi:hypothetical protein